MPISLILTLLKAHWKPILGVLTAITIYVAGFYNGVSSEQEKQEEVERQYQADLQAQKDEWQDKANKEAAEYEADKLKTIAQLAKAKRDLKNELAKNNALRDCTASAGFVQLFQGDNR